MTRQKTVLAIIVGAIVAIAPSFFGYLQARQEIREKYAQGHDEAAKGYTTLVESVKGLQQTALEQHDYIVKLEGQLTALTGVLAQWSTSSPGLRMGSGRPLPAAEKPPARPELPAPPADFTAAQQAR